MSIDSPSPIATLLEITMWNHQRQNINVIRVSADFLTTGSNRARRNVDCIGALPQMLVEKPLTIPHRSGRMGVTLGPIFMPNPCLMPCVRDF